MKQTLGYTLLEISIVVTLLSGLFLITATVMVRGLQVVATQNAYADVSEALRTVSLSVANELASAVLNDIPGNNAVKGLVVAGGKSTSLVFQRPLSLDGLKFSSPATLQVRNEDKNSNLKLDSGEDANNNGVLDRVLERIEDLDGDGKYTSAGETRILARNIDSVTFTQDPGSHRILVTVTARSGMSVAGVMRTLTKQHQFSVFVRN